jgi:HSP20 family molecular chaperone IbpA
MSTKIKTLTQTDDRLAEANDRGAEPRDVENEGSRLVFRPQVDIVEKDEAIFLIVDMPGVDEQRVELSVEKDVMTLHGTVAPPAFDGLTLAYGEYRVGDYRRSFQLSNEIDRAGVEATVRHGVLTVKLPKAKHALNTKIPVTAG